MKEKILKHLKLTKNALSDDAKEYAAQIEALIKEVEAMPEEINADDLKKKIEAIEAAATKAAEAKADEVTNKMKVEVAKQIAVLQNQIQNSFVEGKKDVHFLKTKEANKSFFETVKNNKSFHSFKSEWKKVLVEKGVVKNDIDSNGVLLPAAALEGITDLIKEQNSLISLLPTLSSRTYKLAVNMMNPEADESRAGRHTKGETKTKQLWNLAPKTIRREIIYKLLAVDYETISECDNETSLLNYIKMELVKMFTNEIERAILVGDGRLISDKRHITSFETIARDTSNAFITVINTSNSLCDIEEAAAAVDSIESGNNLVAVMSKAQRRKLKRFVAATGGSVQFISDEILADQLGVTKILINEHVKAENNACLIVIDVDSYIVLNKTTEELYDYDLRTNEHLYEVLAPAGGGLTKVYSAAVVSPVSVSGEGE